MSLRNAERKDFAERLLITQDAKKPPQWAVFYKQLEGFNTAFALRLTLGQKISHLFW